MQEAAAGQRLASTANSPTTRGYPLTGATAATGVLHAGSWTDIFIV